MLRNSLPCDKDPSLMYKQICGFEIKIVMHFALFILHRLCIPCYKTMQLSKFHLKKHSYFVCVCVCASFLHTSAAMHEPAVREICSVEHVIDNMIQEDMNMRHENAACCANNKLCFIELSVDQCS